MAKQVMACKELWIGACMVAFKMSEAESELDTATESLVKPLVCFGQTGYKHDRSRWSEVLKAERWLVQKLHFCLVQPNALQLVDRMAHDVQLPGMADEARDRSCWAGLVEGQLPLLRGPLFKNAADEERKIKMAMPMRRITHFQVLARFLGELAMVHKPRDAYGDEHHPCLLAIAVVQLALHSFNGVAPPGACVAELAKIQVQLLLDAKVSEDIPLDLEACIYHLWSRLPQSSPVLKKWRAREEHLGGALPSAPSGLILKALGGALPSTSAAPSPEPGTKGRGRNWNKGSGAKGRYIDGKWRRPSRAGSRAQAVPAQTRRRITGKAPLSSSICQGRPRQGEGRGWNKGCGTKGWYLSGKWRRPSRAAST